MRAISQLPSFISLAALLLSGCWEPLSLSEFTDTETVPPDIAETDVAALNPCNEIRCTTPPKDACVDEETGAMTRYARNGWCEVVDDKPVCRYATYKDTCLKGTCTEASGCIDTTLQASYCFAQETSTCENGTLRVPYPHGVATSAGCVYSAQIVSCDIGCNAAKNACADDPCAGRVCNDPPARFCQDDLLIVWSTQGRCTNDGECTYTKRTIACDEGCKEGRCMEANRCAYTVCNLPPANFCLDAHTLYSYSPKGACDEGACRYLGESIACTAGCRDGHCNEDPCLGTACVFPTAPSCTQTGDLKVWDGFRDEPIPLCEGGTCQFGLKESKCTAGQCGNGRCLRDDCAGFGIYCQDIHMPADYCNDAFAITNGEDGTCIGTGYCDYSMGEVSARCDTSCEWGQCRDVPADPFSTGR